MNSFSNKAPAESIYFGIDFSAILSEGEELISASVEINVLSGVDNDASSMLTEPPVVESTIVKQKIENGVKEVAYEVIFQVFTSDSQSFVEKASLLVSESV